MKEVIKANSCTFKYNNAENLALDKVSLFINEGECVVLCGQSGCGKTTFMRLLNGLIPELFQGEFNGECISFDKKAGESSVTEYVSFTGSVFQNPKTQYFNVDTTSELAFPCENSGMSSKEICDRVEECAKEFELEKLLNRSIFKLSGGEKQRIAFGVASMLKPSLLVLDEPTSNLDAPSIEKVHDIIAKMKEKGVTIVIAEHRLAWISDIADRYVLFENGVITANYRTEELKAKPRNFTEEKGLRPLDISTYRNMVIEKSKLEPQKENSAIITKNLVIGYDKKSAVYTIPSFQINHGEILALMGHNGVGKSTFAKTLCGLQKSFGGEILWHHEIAKPKTMIKNSFLVMQDVNYQLFSDTVKEEVLLGAKLPELCDDVLSALGLDKYSERHPMSLSGGQKQRVAIASAILSGIEFYVLDEPTSGLEYYLMTQVAKLLQLLKERNTAVMVITHDEELAAEWCDRVFKLD